MFGLKKKQPQPAAKELHVVKKEFREALDKLIDDAESDGLYLGEAQDIMQRKIEFIDQMAAMSVVRKPHWHPDPTPVVHQQNTPNEVSRLADIIRGGPRS
jgi:hypothetical protein